MKTPAGGRRLPSSFVIPIVDPRLGLRVLPRRNTNYSRPIFFCALLLLCGGEARAAVAPIISAIPDQVTHEDEPILRVPFTVWDADSPLDRLRFFAFFSLNNINSADNIVIGGTGSNRWFSIYPPPDSSGLAQASITVSHPGGLSATARF